MKFSKKAIIPLSLSTALLMAACGDAKDEVKKEVDEQTTETIKEATQDESEQLEKSQEPKEPLKTIMLIPENKIDQVSFPLDDTTIISYLSTGGFIPEGYKIMSDGVEGNINSYTIYEDMDEHIVTFDVLHVNVDTGLVSSDYGDFDHVNVETEALND